MYNEKWQNKVVFSRGQNLVEENGGVRKVIECSAVFFRRAAGAACSIDEPTDSIHFEQFILLRRSDVFKDFGSSFGADSFLDGLEHAKRVGDGRFFHPPLDRLL